MADQADTTTPAARWTRGMNLLHSLNAEVRAAPGAEVDELELAAVAVETALLGTPAPDLRAVRDKLLLLWQLRLEDGTPEGRYRRQLIADVTSLIHGCAPAPLSN